MHLFQLYPKAKQRWDDMLKQTVFTRINKRHFQKRKEKLLLLEREVRMQPTMDEAEQQRLLASLSGDESQLLQAAQGSGVVGRAKQTLAMIWNGSSKPGDTFKASHASSDSHEPSNLGSGGVLEDDAKFLSWLTSIQDDLPVLKEEAASVIQIAHDHFHEIIYKKSNELASNFEQVQMEACNEQIRRETSHFVNEQTSLSRSTFISAVKDTFITSVDG